MDREEKLILLFMGVALFGLAFHALDIIAHSSGTNERMARDGYHPRYITGDPTVYWYKPVDIEEPGVKRF